jgi:mono/diheme cytochrome c family protein
MGGMMGGGMMGENYDGTTQQSVKGTPGAGIFRANCARCHPGGGNVISPNLPLNGSDKLANFKRFLSFIRHPKMPDGSEGAMPAFPGSKISDLQARRLYQFITATVASGMTGGGYGMGPGMMGPGYYGYSPECQKFYDETLDLRKELNNKRFEYFEALRNPKTTGEDVAKLEREMNGLQNKIYSKAPFECRWW